MGKSQQHLLNEAHRRFMCESFMRENKRVFSVCYNNATIEAQVINKKTKKEDDNSINQASETQ